MIVIADTSGIIAAADRNAAEHFGCRKYLELASLVVISQLVLTEVDHLARQRFGLAHRNTLMDFLFAQVDRMRFTVMEARLETLKAARAVERRYRDLELDLADAVNVALAAEYDTDAILTLDRRDFRAMRPLADYEYFRVLPDDE
ncbi:putative nucleic acid-binding protein, contains PIN domain [Nocardia amikacinitolerans]|uniref:type II toxin-antitoxin system VapC family toxin n=1 Tax=Nocardia amikacinitolerans TaxID=756689 RepID=UPI00082A9E2F|nr:PIN domain-containing protein [Nocardia amikacinitolerans]MCP2319031.1 putative nucleic acid-binding protein, contains PIN domain [Nocardia amikacinitolerans]